MQLLTPPTDSKLQPADTSGGGGAGAEESNRSPVQVDVHRSGADNQLIASTMVRHVQTSESAATTTLNDNDDEKENEEAASASGTATVSFEMKAAAAKQPRRKTSSLKRSESGGVRPKEKLHGALPLS